MLSRIKRLIDNLTQDKDGFAGALSGTYDLRGDRLTGKVIAELRESRKSIEVQVLRNGRVVASFPTAVEGDGRAHAFEIRVEGLLTAEEIVREKVELKAVNRRGDSGPLALEGTTRLELIREHLGIPVETIFDLDMTRGGNTAGYLGKGWSGPEESFTWTEDDSSYVTFPTPAKRGPHLLRMRAAAFITDFVPRQTMELSLNGEVFAAFFEDDTTTQFREFKIDGELFGNQEQSVLHLYHPWAGQPSGPPATRDNRRLAFSFRRLTLVRVLNTNL